MMIEVIGPVVSMLGAGATAVGFVVGFLKLRAERAKLAAEARKADAEAEHASADTHLLGATVVKDISEAAAILVVPYRIENAELRQRLEKLEQKVEVLEVENRGKDEELRRERARFEERTKLLVAEYEAKLSELRKDIE